MITILWFIIFVTVFPLLALGALIDWKRKKNNNNPHISTNPNVKPGDTTNYRVGGNENNTGGF